MVIAGLWTTYCAGGNEPNLGIYTFQPDAVARIERQLVESVLDASDVVGAVSEPMLPGRRSIATGSSVLSAPWSTNAHNG